MPPSPDDVARARLSALDALNRGSPKEAIGVLESALSRDPGAVELLDLLARAHAGAGDVVRAESVAQRILRALPQRHGTRLWLAQLLETKGEHERARSHYEALATQDGLAETISVPSRLGLARIYIATRDPARARRALEPLLARSPSTDAVLLELRALEGSGHAEQGIELLRRFRADVGGLDHRLASLLRQRGLEDCRAGRKLAAVDALREAAALDPSTGVLMDYAWVLAAAGEKNEAIELLQHLVEREGVVESIVAPLGELLLEADRAAEALELAEVVRDVDSRSAQFAAMLELRALAAGRRDDDIISSLDRFIRVSRESPDAMLTVLWTLESLERRPLDAIQRWLDLEEVPPLEIRPALAHVLRRAGSRALRDGDPSRASSFIREGLALAPGDRALLRQLGWAELSAGSPERALDAWSVLIDEGGESAGLLQGVARAQHAAGRISDAIRTARSILDRDPADGAARRLHWRLLDEADRSGELLSAIDADSVPNVEAQDVTIVAAILDRRRRESGFRDVLRRWIDRLPDDPALQAAHVKALWIDGRAAERRGDRAMARTHFRRIIDLDRDSALARANVARLLRLEGDLEAAIDLLSDARDLEPDNVVVLTRLAQCLREAGRLAQALEVLQSIGPETAAEAPLMLELAKLHYAESRFRDAASVARTVAAREVSDEQLSDALEIWTDALIAAGDAAEALPVLERIACRNPDDSRSLLRFYELAVESGRTDQAIATLDHLAAEAPEGASALAILIRHSLRERDFDSARERIVQYTAQRPRDASMWSTLGRIELDAGALDAAGAAYLAAIEADPSDSTARLGIAVVEQRRGNLRKALSLIDDTLDRDAYFIPARVARVHSLEALRCFDAALHEIEWTLRRFPEDIEIRLLEARILASAGRCREAHDRLRAFRDHSKDGALLVLHYPRVSAHHEPDAVQIERFREQMCALRARGYEAVRVAEVREWLAGRADLPELAVLLTVGALAYEDARLVDATLEELGLRAVCFVPTRAIESYRAYYMSWRDLRELGATGRWEFGASERLAGNRVPAEEGGGPFVSSPSRSADEEHRERRGAMASRLAADYHDSRAKLEAELGAQELVAYSIPPGGSDHPRLANEPEAYAINMTAVRRHFEFVVQESKSGLNIRGTGGQVLNRLDVPPSWDRERLLGHLRSYRPETLASIETARVLIRCERPAAARMQLDNAISLGAPDERVLELRAAALRRQGDVAAAAMEYRRLLEIDPSDPTALEELDEIELSLRPVTRLALDLAWDSDERLIARERLRAEFSPLPWLRLHGEAGHAVLDEPMINAIDGIVAEAGAVATVDGPLRIEGAMGTSVFGGAPDAFEYAARLRWGGFDRVTLEAETAGGAVQAPRAALEGIRIDSQMAAAAFLVTPLDRVRTTYRHAYYSDENRRNTVRWEYSHRILPGPALWLGYDGAYDDARFDAVEYYSPDAMHLHRGFARIDYDVWETLRISGRVGSGYGWEDRRGRIVADGSAQVTWHPTDRLELSAQFRHFRNPNYWSSIAGLTLSLRF